ncbi:MAG: LysR substrate-binding domain-containing protein [bacterium]
MNLKQLEAFRAVMITGSVTAGADMLHVSQPGVSRLIGDLERAVGFKLFVREKGRLYPTPEGSSFYSEIEKTFLGLDRLGRVASEIKEMRRGYLRIAGMPSVSLELVPTIIDQFSRKHADLKLTFETHVSLRIVESIAAQDFDVGIAQMNLDQKGIRIARSYKMNCVCVAPRHHRFRELQSVTPDDLKGEPFIALSQNTLIAIQIDRVIENHGLQRNICFQTQPSLVACSLVAKGLGVALIDPLTAGFFDEHRIVVKPFFPQIPFSFRIIQPAHAINSLAADSFIEQAAAVFSAHESILEY